MSLPTIATARRRRRGYPGLPRSRNSPRLQTWSDRARKTNTRAFASATSDLCMYFPETINAGCIVNRAEAFETPNSSWDNYWPTKPARKVNFWKEYF